MFTLTDTSLVVVTQEAQDVINLGRRHHWRFRLITDFQGVINRPVYNAAGDWLYMPMRAEDKGIIPKAAFRRHETIVRAGFCVAQIVIGHEIKAVPEVPEQPPAPSTSPATQINWQNVAEVAGKGLLIGMMGLAMVSFYALTGVLSVADPSYCIVLAGAENSGSVIELIRWNTEVNNGTTTLRS